jgi:general secretion pathway protein A
MYENFYGFREKPFSLLPDPEFLYLSANHSSAFSVLEYGLTGQAGFTVISGEVGSGKTTLLRSFLRQVGPESTVGLISNTPQDYGSLLRWIMYAFELDYQGKETVELYEAFTDFMIAQYAVGKRCVLIIDEAQNLKSETLEELRMLSNVNASKDLLLQVILVGQPELAETLNRPDMQQFAQRVSISYHLKSLTLEETHIYIRHRLTVAGGDADLFTGAACDALHILSKGIPRLINGLCDIALVYGFGEESRQIDLETVLAVMEDRSRSGQWMGAGPPSQDFLRAEIRRLEAARAGKVVARSAKLVGRQGAGAETSFTVVPSEANPDDGPRVVSTVASPPGTAAPKPSGPPPNGPTATLVSSQGNAGRAGPAGVPPPTDAADGQRKEGAAATHSLAAAPSVPVAPVRSGPRQFSPEFTGSRRQPAPKPFAYQGKTRWVLAVASLAIFLLGLWLVLAAPKISF